MLLLTWKLLKSNYYQMSMALVKKMLSLYKTDVLSFRGSFSSMKIQISQLVKSDKYDKCWIRQLTRSNLNAKVSKIYLCVKI